MPRRDTATDGAAEAHSRYPELAGRFAVVAGSTSEIGLSIARALAAQGINILLNSVGNPTETEQFRADLCREYGVAAACIQADLRQTMTASILAVLALNAFGRIDILVNNVGIQRMNSCSSLPPGTWDAALTSDLSATLLLTRALIGGMQEQGWGRIINIGPDLSTAPSNVACAVAKHDLIRLTNAAAEDGAGHGITCNAICLEQALTSPVGGQTCAQGISGDAVADHAIPALQSNKNDFMAEQLGAFVAFLCSDAAASISGVTFVADNTSYIASPLRTSPL